jgi:hypothetical protein
MTLTRRPAFLALSVLGLTTLGLSLACNGALADKAQPTGTVTTIITDAPADAWSAVEVVVKSVAFRSKADHAKTVVALNGNSTRINLVDLDEVGEVLGNLKVPVGTYDGVILEVDTDPANIKLVRADGSHVPASQLRVVGPGRILVALDQDLVVTENGSNQVQIDFDLGHPVFLVDLADGSVMLNLNAPGLLRHKGLAMVQHVEFRRAVGTVQAVNPGRFKMNTLHGADLDLTYSAASTWIYNVDARAAGSYADLAPGKAIAVAMNLQADGSLLARRIWYSTDARKLPDWSPEGHVVKVDVPNSKVTVLGANGLPVDFAVDAATSFTWHTTVALGTGATGLGRVQRGFKVDLVVADPAATTKVLSAVNVQKAVDEGLFSAVDPTSFTFGTTTPRTYAYRVAPAFAWWSFADPMAASTNVADFASAANVGLAQGRARGIAWLGWGGTAWKAAACILMPVALPSRGTITSYDPGTSTVTVSCQVNGAPAAFSLKLSSTLPVTTGVWNLSNQSGVVTCTQAPLASWGTTLTVGRTLTGTYVPQADGTLKAYTLILMP